MKIKCINNKNIEGCLKLGLVYPYEEETETQFIIKLGNGVRGHFNKNRFERS